MNDRELIFKIKEGDSKASNDLFLRYQKLVYKHLHILERQTQKYDFKEDFIGDSYEVFLKAVKAINLNKIKNDNWKFLGYYGFYLKNLRISYVNNLFKKNKKEVPLIKMSKEGKEYYITDSHKIYTPNAYVEIEEKIFINQLKKDLSDRQKFILDSKLKGYNNSEIAQKLKVSNALITFELNKMKKIYEKAI